jgi:D-sedoheptulose 7-phosphate isomerase
MIDLINKIQNTLEVSSQIHNILCKDLNLINKLCLAAQQGAQSITEGGKIIFAGNGGSFADAQHLSAEFIGTMGRQRRSLPAMAIGTNLSSLTAISNDYSYPEAFARELSAIGEEKDFVILLSTSGNSKNLIEMVKIIKKKKMKSIGFLGGNGGKLAEDIPHIIAPSDRTERIQECHILFGHIFCELVEDIIVNFDTN